MIGRRGFLGLFGTAPLVAKVAADKAIADAAKLDPSGLGGSVMPGPVVADSGPGSLSPSQIKTALQVPGMRGAVETLLFENNKSVFSLDPDLAAMKSFSMAAKITFQRQRNVARAIDDMSQRYWYSRMLERLSKGVFGL